MPTDLLSSFVFEAYEKGRASEGGLAFENRTRIGIPADLVTWWKAVAAARGVAGILRALPFREDGPFGEILDDGTSAIFVSEDPRVTPPIFVRANGVHEIRHMEQNIRPWLVDETRRNDLIRILLADYGGTNPRDERFMQRYHDLLPEEVDAYAFQKEVAGFDGRQFSRVVRKAMRGEVAFPDPAKYVVPVTRSVG